MRFLVFSQKKSFFKFVINYFSSKKIIELSSNEEDFFDKFYLYDYDLILIDLSENKDDLSNLIKEVKQEKKNIPIICLSESTKCKNLKRLLSLQADYLLFGPNFDNLTSSKISLGCLTLDLNKDIFIVKDQILKLGRREYVLLKFLFLNQNKFSSKTKLTQEIIEDSYSVKSNMIDVYIYRLRKILKEQLSNIKIISCKDFGYKITTCTDS